MDKSNKKIDILNREGVIEDLFHIAQSVSKNKGYCSFAVEGAWGVGKTYQVLQFLKKDIPGKNKKENRMVYVSLFGKTTIDDKMIFEECAKKVDTYLKLGPYIDNLPSTVMYGITLASNNQSIIKF